MRIAKMVPETPQASVVENRRAKLRAWIDANCQGLQSEFLASCARHGYELSQSELSGLLRTKSFGEKKARAIELGSGMPVHYLDKPADGAAVPAPTAPLSVRESDPSDRWRWPFSTVRPEQYALLDDEQRTDIEKYVLLQIKTREPPAEKQAPPATRSAKVQSA